MSITDKLRKLINIKSDIKNAIISKGVSVTDSTLFEDYPAKIAEIPSGGSSTSGDLFNTKSCYLMSIPTEYEGIKGLKIKSNNKTSGRPIYIAGIKPYYFYEGEDPNDLNTRETFKYKSGSSEINFKFKELIYRQRFVIEDQYDTPHTSIEENEFRAFMVCEGSETSNNPATSLGSYRIYFNTPATSGYYATLYPIYTCNIWRNGDPIHVKVGDIVDITYEFENDNTLKITTKINDNDAVISYSSSSDASAITELGNRYINSNTFGGHTHLNGFGYDKFGINAILLEGTSIYSKVHNKYIWQLFK